MELVDEVSNSLNRYFSLLSHTGYKPYSSVFKLLTFTFIEEILYGPMSEFVTDEDYSVISNALECLYGTCMIPYPEYKKGIEATTYDTLLDEFRITETDVLRNTQTDKLRTVS